MAEDRERLLLLAKAKRKRAEENPSGDSTQPKPTAGRTLFPATSAAMDRGAGLAGKAAGVASDVASGLLRVPAAAGRTLDTKMGFSGNGPQSYLESLDQINQGLNARGEPSLISKVTRDPAAPVAVATLPLTGPILAGVRGAGLPMAAARLAGVGAIEGAASGAAHNVDEFARTGSINPANIPLEAATGAVLGPVAGGVGWTLGQGVKALRGLGRGVQEVLPPPTLFPSQGIPQSVRQGVQQVAPGQVGSMTTRQGITLTPSQVAGETVGLRPAIEQYAQTNPFLANIPGEIADRNAQAIPAAVLAQRNQFRNPIAGVDDIVPSAVGGRIDETARAARNKIGDTYHAAEDAALEKTGIAGMDLPTHHAPKRGPDGRMMKNQVLDVVKDADDYLREAGYDAKKGFTGQEKGLAKSSLDYVLKQKDLIANAKTTKDLLYHRRRIAGEIYDGMRGETPLFPQRDDTFLKGFERKINDAIERQFDLIVGPGQKQLPNDVALAAKNLWNANKQTWSQGKNVLDAVDNKLGVSSAKTTTDQYFDRIKNIGTEDLKALKEAAKKNGDLQPMFEEIQSGYFDQFLKKAASKGPDGKLTISPEKLITQWRGMDKGQRDALMPEAVVKEMDELIDVVGKSRTNQANLTNPSGTARLLNITDAVRNPTEWIQGLMLRGPVKKYYKTGEILPMETSVNTARQVGKLVEGTGRVAQPVVGGLRALAGNPVSRQGIRTEVANIAGLNLGLPSEPSLSIHELVNGRRRNDRDTLLSQLTRGSR